MRTDEWRAIEAAALEQVRADLRMADTTPLEYGRVIAWVESRFGRTDDLGAVHRVGRWSIDSASTICGEVIPAAIRHIPLNPTLVRSLDRCRYCEAEYAQKGVAA